MTIDYNDPISKYCLEWFKELEINNKTNWNNLFNLISDYIDNLELGREKYLKDKISFISNAIDSKLDDSDKKKSAYIIIQYFESLSFYVEPSENDTINDFFDPPIEENNEGINAIQLNLTQVEILGIVEAFINSNSKKPITPTNLFKFCSNNFISKNAKKEQTINSYHQAYYKYLYAKEIQSKEQMYNESKSSIIDKLNIILNTVKSS